MRRSMLHVAALAAMPAFCLSTTAVAEPSVPTERLRPSVLQSIPMAIPGIILAPDRVELRSDIAAAISEVRVREGDAFRKGDPLLRFNCEREAAELAAAKARADASWVEATRAKHLHSLGAGGQGDVRSTNAKAVAASAEADALQARLRACSIAAPFDGRVAEVKAKAFSYPERGTPLITVVGRSRLEVELIAPSTILRTVSIEHPFEFEVSEIGIVLGGAVDRVAAEVDPASKTIKVYGQLEAATEHVLPGMSGIARFGAK